MTEEKLKWRWRIYTECWKFFKKFSSPVDDDKFWEELVLEKDKLQILYDGPLFQDIMVATVKEIERIWKKGDEGNG